MAAETLRAVGVLGRLALWRGFITVNMCVCELRNKKKMKMNKKEKRKKKKEKEKEERKHEKRNTAWLCILHPITFFFLLLLSFFCSSLFCRLFFLFPRPAERDKNGDVLWTWVYPELAEALRTVIEPKTGLAADTAAAPVARFGRFKGAWYHFATTVLPRGEEGGPAPGTPASLADV